MTKLLLLLSLSFSLFAIAPSDVATTDIRKLVDVKSIRGAKGSKRIVVPGYRVVFTTRSKVTARAEDWLGGVGGGSSSGAKASMEVVLGNVDFALLHSALVHERGRPRERSGHVADELQGHLRDDEGVRRPGRLPHHARRLRLAWQFGRQVRPPRLRQREGGDLREPRVHSLLHR